MRNTFGLPLPLCALALGGALIAQTPVKDINTAAPTLASSSPTNFVTLGSITLFTANDGFHGIELWRTDGTAAGTTMVKDINPGSASASPTALTLFNGFVYFSANNGVLGSELWRTDGTAAGTTLVKDCYPGSGSAAPSALVVVGSTLYFSAFDGTATVGSGRELWKSDGTTGGTQLILDILAGTGSGIVSTVVSSYAPLGTGLVFAATTGTTAPGAGEELWFTDGTAAGTVQLLDINAGTASSTPRLLTAFNGKVCFTATDGTVAPGSGTEMWVTDGTPAGTMLLKDMYPGTSSSSPSQPVVSAGKMFFSALDGTASTGSGRELWVSDGTAAGTVLVTNLNPATASAIASTANLMVPFGNGVLVGMTDGTTGEELWFSDGTAAGTMLVANIAPTTASSTPRAPQMVGGKVFFAATTTTTGYELWVTDGTTAGTTMVKEINSGTAAGISSAFLSDALGSSLVFPGIDTTNGTELWISDGTSAGTVLVKNIAVNQPAHANPANLAEFGNRTIFAATDGTSGIEPWITDGTPAGTFMLADIFAGASSSSPANFTVMGDKCFFTASNGTTAPAVGNELWVTDGTTAGTQLVLDINPGTVSSSAINLVVGNGKLWFLATTAAAGRELWTSDGTPAGTQMVVDFNPGTANGAATFAQSMIPFGNGVIFSGTTPTEGTEICVSDGTAAGTKAIDLIPGTNGATPSPFIVLNGVAYCNAQDAATGFELVRTDGTLAGTSVVKDLVPGTGEGNPGPFAVLNGKLYFFSTDPATGTELWVSDGTAAGTVMVKDINPGAGSSVTNSPFAANLVVAGDRLFFPADDGTNGIELWTSDGTAAGTVMVRDLNPGAEPGLPSLAAVVYPAGVGRRVLFAGNDGTNGQEPWISDGTSAGTTLVSDMYPGSIGSTPGQFLVNVEGSAVYFPTTDDVVGRELFTMSAASLAIALVEPYGTGCAGTNGRVPQIGADAPVLGNLKFTVTVSNALPSSKGALVVALGKANMPLSGCTVLVDVTMPHVVVPVTTSAAGVGTNVLPIRNNAFFVGHSLCFQYVILDPAGTLFNAASLTGGLRAQIGR